MINTNSQRLKVQTEKSAVGGMWAFLVRPLGQCYHLVHLHDPVMMNSYWTRLTVLYSQELLFAFFWWMLVNFFSRSILSHLYLLTLPYSSQRSFPLINYFLSHTCPVQIILPRYHSVLCSILFCEYDNSQNIILNYPFPKVCCFKTLMIFQQLEVQY